MTSSDPRTAEPTRNSAWIQAARRPATFIVDAGPRGRQAYELFMPRQFPMARCG